MIVFSFLGSLYLFGGSVRHWASTPKACVDTMGFSPCSAMEEVACKDPEQTLTWQPAKPSGFVYQCTCFRPAPKK
jgi:hypothetical protein